MPLTILILSLCILSSGFAGNIYKKLSVNSDSLAASLTMPSLWFVMLAVFFGILSALTGEIPDITAVPISVLDRLPNVRVCGVMGMATNTDDMGKVREEFKSIKNVFDTLKQRYFADKPYFKEISMGMSDDYHIAMEEGSTLVRIGTTIFGSRGY